MACTNWRSDAYRGAVSRVPIGDLLKLRRPPSDLAAAAVELGGGRRQIWRRAVKSLFLSFPCNFVWKGACSRLL